MLVLLRKVGEEVIIGKEISVRVLRVARNRAFLAIEAPAKVAVDRKEIWLAKKRERLAAGDGGSARLAGSEETRQSTVDCEAGSVPATVGISFVRRAIPMLNRMSGKDKAEKDLAKRDARCRVHQVGVPPDGQPNPTSLRATVHRLIADSQTCDGPEIEFCDDLDDGELPPELQRAVFSIVRELLLNACRHSKTKNVLLGIAQDEERVCIQVQDWGVGFDPKVVQPQKLGLQRVRRLARRLGGTLDIDSRVGAGTCIVAEILLLPGVEPNHHARERRPK
ncbi:MAG: hypothetical protein GXY83_28030 [Rhodopirellula sp.]|nr:hypothetical protein [Rhodopirellula sp.]